MKRRRYELGLAGLSIEWAAAILGFTLLGVWLDRRWESAPWAVVICASLGFVGGTYNFIRSAQKAARRAQDRALEQKKKGDAGGEG